LINITGYKLRKHIAKALQSRSQAIRTALDRYNTAARALPIPRRQLEWKEVVEYAFLADFDLLRDARQDISHRPWATPAGRLAMDLYFKIQRAREEIDRLNIEVKRVATYIRDEKHYLRNAEKKADHQILESLIRYGCIAWFAGASLHITSVGFVILPVSQGSVAAFCLEQVLMMGRGECKCVEVDRAGRRGGVV
jgi:hypothetical protein